MGCKANRRWMLGFWILPEVSIQAQARVREMMGSVQYCTVGSRIARDEGKGRGAFQGPDEEMTQSFEAIQWTIPRDDNDKKS